MTIVSIVGLAACFTAALCPWLTGFLRRSSMVDVETKRSSHQGAIPRGGGLAVLFGALLSLLVHWSEWAYLPHLGALSAVAIGFGVLGLIDDVRTLPALTRLVAQAVLAAVFLASTDLQPIPALGVAGVVIGGIWVMAFVNAFNFMDGINGISVASTSVIGISLAVASYRWDGGIEVPALAVVGASLGFAPFNAMSARVFLGDVGSYLLGSSLALLAMVAVANGTPPLAVAFPFGVYVGDVSFTVVSRACRRQRLLKSHREHVYQRITTSERLSHQQTTVLVTVFTIALAILGQAGSSAAGVVAQSAVLLAGSVVVLTYLRMPHLVALLSKRRLTATRLVQ